MRIMHFIPTNDKEYGGPVVVAEEIVRELNKREIINAQIISGVKEIKYINKINILNLICFNRFIKRVLSDYDLIHVHCLWNLHSSIVTRLARKMNKPYIITPHGMLDYWALKQNRIKKCIYYRIIEKKNIDCAEAIHFLNDEEMYVSLKYISDANIFIIPNGVRMNDCDSKISRCKLENTYPYFNNKLLALFIGRITPKKGFDLLIPALSESIKDNPRIHLIIAGPDEKGYKTKICELIKNYKMEEHITFIGMIKGEFKNEVLHASDLFILPSWQEGDSIAVKEALASGLAVIITSSCHFQDIERFNAGVVIQNDITELVSAINQIASNNELRNIMGKNAIHLINKKYTWSKVVDKYSLIYDDVLFGKKDSPDWYN